MNIFKLALPIWLIFSAALPSGARQNDDTAILRGYFSIDRNSPENFQAFDDYQRRTLFYSVYSNRVARLSSVQKYDPQGIIGFCFGRAMAAHLIARRMGLAAGSIGKLFIIGDLRSGNDPEWRFHVTAIVSGTDSRWYAIDPIVGRPLEINQWIRYVQSVWDRRGKANLYITPGSTILPDMRHIPPVEEEKGEYIIEVSFRPSAELGFLKAKRPFHIAPDLEELVVQPDSLQSAQRYFSDVWEEKYRFDFGRVVINGQSIGYNGYFEDLIADISQAPVYAGAVTADTAMKLAPRVYPEYPLRRDLGSIRFDLIRLLR